MPERPEPDGDDLARQLRAEIAVVAADAQAARTLAAGADRDVSEVRAELRSHTRVIEALRQTQVEHGRAIAALRSELNGLRSETRAGLAGLETEMRTGFATLVSGMADIVTLLQRDENG